ncbi:hypothetical protein [Actinoplanes sp. NPDC051411]|uniref:hypothetical protein n=1 Tax=Actinoplanes sp. NPDC051411 TaxID=3155522 RepID=UPI003438EEC6
MNRPPRWMAPLFAVLGAGTVPWTVYLSLTLPDHARTHNYRLAWVGFDVMLIVAMLLTAYLAWRGRPLAGQAAGCTATMLVVDAWFDVTTSGRPDVGVALLLAALVELPLAALCGWIALLVQRAAQNSATGAG